MLTLVFELFFRDWIKPLHTLMWHIFLFLNASRGWWQWPAYINTKYFKAFFSPLDLELRRNKRQAELSFTAEWWRWSLSQRTIFMAASCSGMFKTAFCKYIINIPEFPGGTVVKNPTADARDTGPVPGSGRSPRRGWQPTLVFLPARVHGQRSRMG